MRRFKIIALTLAITLILGTASSFACSAVYVGRNVSNDGTTMIARSEDQSNGDYNKMQKVVARETKAGRVMVDTGNGFKIPLPKTTYKYTSLQDFAGGEDGPYTACCTNEYGLSVIGTVSASGCTEWEKIDPYVECSIRESIIPGLIASQCKTAKESVKKLSELYDKYGSEEGNITFFADQKEAWIFEVYGGHEYCAKKLSPDKMSVFGNQFMIQCVDAMDKENFVFSKDLFKKLDEFGAVKENDKYNISKTITKSKRDDEDSSANMRTWMGQKIFAPKATNAEYDPAKFYELEFVPEKKVSALDVMDAFRNRYEGTPFDGSIEGNEKHYFIGNERQSDVHLVQIFKNNPAEMSAILWLALGDAENSVFLPSFSGIKDTYAAYKVDGSKYNPSSMFWCFKRICTLAEQNRALYSQGVRDYWNIEEEMLYAQMEKANVKMNKLYKKNKVMARNYVTDLASSIAKTEKKNTDKLFTDLFTTVIHDTGIRYIDEDIFVADTSLKKLATFKGYSLNKSGIKITLTNGIKTVKLTIGETKATSIVKGIETTFTLTKAPYKEKGTLYVPVGFINEL